MSRVWGAGPLRAAGYWRVTDGLPVPQFSHHDATPLCRTRSGAVTEPIEAPVESPLKDSRAEAGERP